MKGRRNGRRRNDEWFGEKQRKGIRKRCPGEKEEEGEAESRVGGRENPSAGREEEKQRR